MAINAVALLRVPASSLPGTLRVIALDDAVLVHTSESFGSEPDELAELLHDLLGDVLSTHEDARGIFILPSIASPKARSYDAVIAEIGAGGMWAPRLEVDDGFVLPDGLGGLGAVLSSMVQNMPQSVLDAAAAAARNDAHGFSKVTDQVATLMGQQPRGPVDMNSLLGLVGSGGGLDLSSPMFQQLLANLQGQLERDPEGAARLAEQLFGTQAGQAGNDDDDEPK